MPYSFENFKHWTCDPDHPDVWVPPYTDKEQFDRYWQTIYTEYQDWRDQDPRRDRLGTHYDRIDARYHKELQWCADYKHHLQRMRPQVEHDPEFSDWTPVGSPAQGPDSGSGHGSSWPRRPGSGCAPSRGGRVPEASEQERREQRERQRERQIALLGGNVYQRPAKRRDGLREMMFAMGSEHARIAPDFRRKNEQEKILFLKEMARRTMQRTDMGSPRWCFGKTLGTALKAKLKDKFPLMLVPPLAYSANVHEEAQGKLD